MRKVMMVVAVLITSCHVSTLGKSQKDGTHRTTRRTHATKNGVRLTKPADASAKRSKSFTFCSAMSSPLGAVDVSVAFCKQPANAEADRGHPEDIWPWNASG